jgi:hypothetical protein
LGDEKVYLMALWRRLTEKQKKELLKHVYETKF